MSLHILPQSVLAISRALGSIDGVHAKKAAVQPPTGAPDSGHPPVASQPFSCMSSGRAKAIDVEAARRYYVGSV